MKKSYVRLIVYQLVMLIIYYLLSNFVSSILGEYFKVVAIGLFLVIFKLFFGFEKDRHRDTKNVCMEIVIYLLIYFLLYYLIGIIISFSKTINYWHLNGILLVILPLILTIILKEILRYMMIRKSENSKYLLIANCLFFIVFDLINTFNNSTFSSTYSSFIYVALIILPTITRNVFATYVSYKTGYKPVILYFLVMNLYSYLLPIIPNPNNYIYSVVELIVPMLFMYGIYRNYKKEKDDRIEREYNKKRITGLIFPTILVVFMVYITSGYFYYHAIVIASGSMEPNLYIGDVVVIEKVDKKEIEVGDIIAYKYDGRIIVHRLVKLIKIGDERMYYTKGDANNSIDNYKITEDMVIGVVNIKVPYIGYPTVWVNEL